MMLRKQIDILMRRQKRPLVHNRDRLFFVLLSRVYAEWRRAFLLFQPDTLIRWHKQGFKLFWRLKSKRKGGRNKIDPELKELIVQMANENPLWGAPRIHGELLKLGFDISQATVSTYMPKKESRPGQNWLTFLHNHLKETVSVDFFDVHTLTYSLLYVFVILSHDRRKIIHFNITKHPTDTWVAQQLIEAFALKSSPRFLIRDRDSKFRHTFKSRLRHLEIHDIQTAYRSPWQNGYVERVIGSIKRECLDHVIIMNETHLNNIMKSYIDYYHNSRTHLGLNKDSPNHRKVCPDEDGIIQSIPQVGGLHHRYERFSA
ncbi:MAG: DDE-type integrase/transposase/recombinase [Candidatus Marinimicrobia bacterium]|nr:DDE-type integrase/transposase/recombinase [Candidatus Neomarinimicrobiota bacterium]